MLFVRSLDTITGQMLDARRKQPAKPQQQPPSTPVKSYEHTFGNGDLDCPLCLSYGTIVEPHTPGEIMRMHTCECVLRRAVVNQ